MKTYGHEKQLNIFVLTFSLVFPLPSTQLRPRTSSLVESGRWSSRTPARCTALALFPRPMQMLRLPAPFYTDLYL